MIELKKDSEYLNYHYYLDLLEKDFTACKPDKPLVFISKDFDRYLQQVYNKGNLTFRELSLLQKVMLKESVWFSNAEDTFRVGIELALEKVKKANLKEPIIIK